MRTLILLRHGEAERRADSGRDVDRALTPAGRRAAAQAGAWLEGEGLRPGLVLVSAARRAQATWDAAGEGWADPPSFAVRPDLYEAAADDILAAAEGEDVDVVLVVAHNPGLHDLAAGLAGSDPRAAQGFPPASLAAFERDGAGWRLLAWRIPAPEPAR